MAKNILELLAKYKPETGENLFWKDYNENLFSERSDFVCVLSPDCVISVAGSYDLPGKMDVYNNFSIKDGIKIEYNKPSFSAHVESTPFNLERFDSPEWMLNWLKAHAKDLKGTFSEYSLVKDGLDGGYIVKETAYRMGSTESKSSDLLVNKINFLNFLMGDYDAIKITGMPAYKYWENCIIDTSHVPISHTENGLYFGTGSNQTVYDEYGPGKQTETTVSSVVSLQKLTEKKVVGNNGKYGIEEKDYYRVESSDAVNNEAPYVGYAENFDSLEEAGKTFISECRRIEKKHHGERNVDFIDLAANKHLEDFAKLEQGRSVSEDADKPKAVNKKKAKTVER